MTKRLRMVSTSGNWSVLAQLEGTLNRADGKVQLQTRGSSKEFASRAFKQKEPRIKRGCNAAGQGQSMGSKIARSLIMARPGDGRSDDCRTNV